MSVDMKIEVQRFDGSGDFSLWKRRMLAHLGVSGLKEVLFDEDLLKESSKEGGDGTDKKEKDPAKLEKSEKAMNMIILNITNKVLRKLKNCETAAAMWKTLDKLYFETSLPNRIYLQSRIYSYKMVESKDIDGNVDDFLKLVADLADIGIEVSEEVQSVLLLNSLPSRYNQLRETLKYGRQTLSLDQVISSAQSKEREFGDNGNSHKGSAEGLYVEQRGRSYKKNNQSNKGRSKSKAKGKNNNGCFICGEEGHWKRDCPQRKQRNFKHSANTVSSSQEPLVLTVSSESTSDEWVIDSGSSFHITPNRDLLYDLEEFEGGKVLMGNNTHSEIKGKGKIRILNPDNSEVVLTDVKYMPSMTRNLISLGLLEKSGCRYSGRNSKVSFYRGKRRVIEGKYNRGLYYLQGRVLKPEAKGQEQILLAEEEAGQNRANKGSSSVQKKEPSQLKGKGKRVSFNPVLEQPSLAESSSTKELVQGGEPKEAESVNEVARKEGLLRKGVKCLSNCLKGVLTYSLVFAKRNQIAIEQFFDGDFADDLGISSKSNVIANEDLVDTKENTGEVMTSVAQTKDNGLGNTPQN